MNADGVQGQQNPPTYVGGSPNNRRLTPAARQSAPTALMIGIFVTEAYINY
ncbi:MAG: hypothetical protein ACRCUY_01240 [Thermoguttaceae bacterium]